MLAKRLTIVVPYRAREAHLRRFVPHMQAYFSRDKTDCEIPYSVLMIEQENGLPFNRGALKNIGFLLGKNESDYSCFHDIDYLPIWADYRWADRPTAILWYGAEIRPVAPGRSQVATTLNLDQYFGGAVLTPNHHFEAVNGYSNAFWGWGFEDDDLRTRFERSGIGWGRRRGTFQPLDHDHEGLTADGQPRPIHRVNQAIAIRRWDDIAGFAAEMCKDGLSSVVFDVLHRGELQARTDAPGIRAARWEMVTARLNMQPRLEQLGAASA